MPEWLPVLLVTAIAPIVAYATVRATFRAHGVDFAGLLYGRIYVRWCALFGFLALATGAFFFLLLGQLLGMPWGSIATVVAAGLCLATLVVAYFRTLAPTARMERLRPRLRDPERRNDAVREIFAIAAAQPLLAQLAAVALNEARLFTEIDTLLDRVRWAKLKPRIRTVLYASLVNARIYRGDLDGAGSALDQGRAIARTPLMKRLFDLQEALLCALRGDGKRALELLGDRPTDKHMRRAWSITRIHAFAALRDDAAAHEAIAALLDDHGVDGLERAAMLSGPGTSLAASVLAGTAKPYR